MAWGSFSDTIHRTGWAVLDVHTAPSAAGDTQSYAAGFLEGALTHRGGRGGEGWVEMGSTWGIQMYIYIYICIYVYS